jgi:hypothetical protein
MGIWSKNCQHLPARRKVIQCAGCLPNSISLFSGLVALVAGLVALALLDGSARAGQPKISYIQTFRTNQLLIHFDTEANLTYILEYSDTLNSNGLPSGVWSILYVTPTNLPFPDHYIVLDNRTSPQRFYRLHVIP